MGSGRWVAEEKIVILVTQLLKLSYKHAITQI